MMTLFKNINVGLDAQPAKTRAGLDMYIAGEVETDFCDLSPRCRIDVRGLIFVKPNPASRDPWGSSISKAIDALKKEICNRADQLYAAKLIARRRRKIRPI